MFRQTAKYAVARWAPGIVNFAAIILYTRLLSKEEYGVYAVAVASVALTNALAYQWLRSGVRRFLIAYRDSRAEFLRIVTRSFAGLSLLLGLGILVAVLLQKEAERQTLVAVGGLLLVTLAWVELNLEIVLADLKPGRYGVATMIRSLASLAGGAGLASLGFGVVGVVTGIALGYVVAGAWLGFLHRTVPSGHKNLPGMQRELLLYGLPLTLTCALDFIVSSSDRLLLGALAGVAAAGAYSAGYDLAQQGMTALMMTVNLGAFPMAVRALETGGAAALQAQLKRHAVILLGLALPASVALVVLGPTLASVALGPEFRSAAAELIPIIGVAALAGGLKAYYFDLAFQLGRDTRRQVWVSGAAAIANVALNLALIPRYGVLGSAWATVASFVLGLGLSIGLRPPSLTMPVPWREWRNIAIATVAMAAAIWPLRDLHGPTGLLLASFAGLCVYGGAAVALDIGGIRQKAWWRASSASAPRPEGEHGRES